MGDNSSSSFIQMHMLPGGIKPVRKSEGAVGYDVAIRAIVSPTDMDPDNSVLRKVLFDFNSVPDDPAVAGHVHNLGNELVYRLGPRETVLVGIGFVTVLPIDMFYWITPRSGLAGKYGITVTNAPGTVDSDYRGEAGVLVINLRSNDHFDLKYKMRIAQIIFQHAVHPQIEEIENYEDLAESIRGAGGFGSTGLRDEIRPHPVPQSNRK